jgi:hypothetical protein
VNPPKADNPLTELREWLAESANRCRTMRWLGALFRVNVAQDIVEDVAKYENAAGQLAYSAEALSLEAINELHRAVQPDSPGGSEITPEEEAEIVRLIRSAANKAHDVSERLVTA